MTDFAPRIDWFRVIVDLERAGWSHRRIAKAMGQHRQSVIGLKNAVVNEPKYTPGQRLIALWCQVTSRSEQHLPREGVGNLDRPGSDTRATSTAETVKEHPHGQSRSHAERPDSRSRCADPCRAVCAAG